jgi:hypothetical protein
MFRTKQRLTQSSTLGLARVRVAPAAPRPTPVPMELNEAFAARAADAKRARRNARRLKEVAAGGWWAPDVDAGSGP